MILPASDTTRAAQGHMSHIFDLFNTHTWVGDSEMRENRNRGYREITACSSSKTQTLW